MGGLVGEREKHGGLGKRKKIEKMKKKEKIKDIWSTLLLLQVGYNQLEHGELGSERTLWAQSGSLWGGNWKGAQGTGGLGGHGTLLGKCGKSTGGKKQS